VSDRALFYRSCDAIGPALALKEGESLFFGAEFAGYVDEVHLVPFRTGGEMAKVKKEGPRSQAIEALLTYAEELLASKLAYESLLASHVSAANLRDLYDQEIEETRKTADIAFRTLWGYSREQDWKQLRATALSETKILQVDLE
jgi:hypothetical protein